MRFRVPLILAALLWSWSAAAPGAGADWLQLEGKVQQGGLVFGRTLPSARVWHDGKPVRVAPDGRFLLGFVRDAGPESELRVQLPDGESRSRTLAVASREYQIQRIDGLPKRMVTPDEASLARIRADVAAVKRARSADRATRDFSSGWEWPLTGTITGVFGSQRVLNGKPRRPHYGVDIAAPTGTVIRAPADGKIALAHPDMYYSGATLIVDHGHGLSTTYLHLSRILVEEGQVVKRGEPLGEVGASGRATGPHLCWRMNLFGKRLDPTTVVGTMMRP